MSTQFDEQSGRVTGRVELSFVSVMPATVVVTLVGNDPRFPSNRTATVTVAAGQQFQDFAFDLQVQAQTRQANTTASFVIAQPLSAILGDVTTVNFVLTDTAPITAGNANDAIVGAGGNDVIDAGAGDNTVTAFGGNDSVTAGAGDDNRDTITFYRDWTNEGQESYNGQTYTKFSAANGATVYAATGINFSFVDPTLQLSAFSVAREDGAYLVGDGIEQFAGWKVQSAGDINQDGIDDMIVNAVDKAYVVFGSQDLSGMYQLSQIGSNGFVVQNTQVTSSQLTNTWLSANQFKFGLAETSLAGRKVFVYAGNMGVAQGMDILLDLAERLQARVDVGFLFVGRGSDSQRLRRDATDRGLSNVLFFDEIDPDEIPDLYAQCSAGLVALDPRHQSHNIPGKFLTYLQSGLPVLANVNAGNDLAEMIRNEQVGQVCESHDVHELEQRALALLVQLGSNPDLSQRCIALFARQFSVEHAVKQIAGALSMSGHAVTE